MEHKPMNDIWVVTQDVLWTVDRAEGLELVEGDLPVSYHLSEASANQKATILNQARRREGLSEEYDYYLCKLELEE